MRIDVKTAVNAAVKAAQEFYSDQQLSGIQLEEVVLDNEENLWVITLSFAVLSNSPAKANWVLAGTQKDGHAVEQKHKVFEINATTGEVSAMRIRKP